MSRQSRLLQSIDGINEKLATDIERICGLFERSYKSFTTKDDLISQATVTILECKDKFSPEKHPDASFSTFIQVCVLNGLRNYIRKARFKFSCSSHDAIKNLEELKEASRSDVDISEVEILQETDLDAIIGAKDILAKLSKEEIDLIEKKFLDNKHYRELADELSISTSGAYYVVKRIVEKIRRESVELKIK